MRAVNANRGLISVAATPTGERSTTGTKVVLALVLLVVYLVSHPWDMRGQVEDVSAATLPAWHLVETGSLDLDEFSDLNLFIVETDRGYRSARAPGLIGLAAIGYALTKPLTDDFEHWPGTLMAVLTSWLAVLFVAASAERLRSGLWVVALVLFGLGTATWNVSAHQFWPHGPAQLAVALGVWLLIKHRRLAAGIAFATGVLIRPPVGLLGFGVALVLALRERSMRTLVRVGGPSVLSGGAILIYNRWTFGSLSPDAAYEAVGGFWLVKGRIGNVIEAFVGYDHGLLVWSAWIGVCAVMVALQRFDAPHWLAATPLIALGYIIVHSMVETASGGLALNYRYPLEAITLATPFLLLAVPAGLTTSIGRVSLVTAGALALFMQGAFAFTSVCWEDGLFYCSLLGR